MQEEVIVTRWEKYLLSMRAEDGKIVQVQADPVGQDGILGNIYVGKVRNIVKNINAAFVEYQKGQVGFLSLNTLRLPLHTDGSPHQKGRICEGDEIIVQVVREAVRTKPPTLSGTLELTGRYVVLTAAGETSAASNGIAKEASQPLIQHAAISKKIQDKAVRERLKQVIGSYCSAEYGFVARTNSVSVPEETVREEIETLIGQYRDIILHGKHKTRFSVLKKMPSSYLSQIRDSYTDNLTRIWTDDAAIYQEMDRYMRENGWQSRNLLTQWDPANGTLDAVYQISKTIQHALLPKVWLKSGGYLVIQPTEALVSIDVNTGKAISRKKDVEQTFRKVNLEAALEIARQLRLRNLSGMILIDFIDMKAAEDNQEILHVLKKAVSRDPIPTTVVDMTKLGLVEVTRKKIRKPLLEQLQAADTDRKEGDAT